MCEKSALHCVQYQWNYSVKYQTNFFLIIFSNKHAECSWFILMFVLEYFMKLLQSIYAYRLKKLTNSVWWLKFIWSHKRIRCQVQLGCKLLVSNMYYFYSFIYYFLNSAEEYFLGNFLNKRNDQLILNFCIKPKITCFQRCITFWFLIAFEKIALIVICLISWSIALALQ